MRPDIMLIAVLALIAVSVYNDMKVKVSKIGAGLYHCEKIVLKDS